MGPNEQAVYDVLRHDRSLSRAEIFHLAQAVPTEKICSQTLGRLKAKGLVERSDDGWRKINGTAEHDAEAASSNAPTVPTAPESTTHNRGNLVRQILEWPRPGPIAIRQLRRRAEIVHALSIWAAFDTDIQRHLEELAEDLFELAETHEAAA